MQSTTIKELVAQVINSNVTAYAIGKGSGVDISMIRRLKTGERQIENTTVMTAQKLIDYGYKVGLIK
ncbi:hypothetical protein [Lactiplantibacillus xiangfangensis]|uniref:hypothetical protein n=1 Tax=Lactiplantibacillus xiangfangensis TaxID=942150 RepID=UPI0007110289|nr:hypothetical protein [Lactiplantibacillus xiangfangensis]